MLPFQEMQTKWDYSFKTSLFCIFIAEQISSLYNSNVLNHSVSLSGKVQELRTVIASAAGCDVDEVERYLEEFYHTRFSDKADKYNDIDELADFYKNAGQQHLADLVYKNAKQTQTKLGKNFCIFADFDAYAYDFKKLGIDLRKDDIDFFTFKNDFSLLFEDENTMSAKRVQYRTYKPQKNEDKSRKAYMRRMKNIYSLN